MKRMQIKLPKRTPRSRVEKKRLKIRREPVIACVLGVLVAGVTIMVPPENLAIISLHILLISAFSYYVVVIFSRIRYAILVSVVIFFLLALLALDALTLFHIGLLLALIGSVIFLSR